MADTIERSNIGRIVTFLLHTDRLRVDEYDLAEIGVLVKHLGTTKEFLAALVRVLHSAREMIRLEQDDAAYRAMELALAPPPASKRRARKPRRRGEGQADLFSTKGVK
jgi:hypothetical protein